MKFKETLRKIVYAPLVLVPENTPYRDKVAHAIVGSILFFIMLFIGVNIHVDMLTVTVVAYTKELLDKYIINGTYDMLDFLATISIPLLVYFYYLLRIILNIS